MRAKPGTQPGVHGDLAKHFRLQVQAYEWLVRNPILPGIEFMNAPKLYLLKRDHQDQSSVVHEVRL